jgi:hypothetical protein
VDSVELTHDLSAHAIHLPVCGGDGGVCGGVRGSVRPSSAVSICTFVPLI